MPVQIDMEMPESCEACPFPSYGSHGIFCAAMKRYADIPEDEIWERRADDCPLVETEDRTWHVVAEGDLPEEKGFYQCTVLDNHKNEVFIADVYKEAAGFFYDNELYEVIAWRELPEPWEGVSEQYENG